VQINIPEVITKTDRYLVVENFFLSKILERAQLETSDPARKTICSVSGIEKEKDQLLITLTLTNKATKSRWRERGILKPSE